MNIRNDYLLNKRIWWKIDAISGKNLKIDGATNFFECLVKMHLDSYLVMDRCD